MSIRDHSHHLHQATTALMAIIIFFVLCASIYHLTHPSLPSGITELVLAFCLALSWSLILHSYKVESFKKSTVYRKTGLSIIGICAVVLLYFGIYHLTTPTGLRSGIVELTMTGLLILFMCIVIKAKPGDNN